jgi:hypothetical protein
MAFRLEEKHQRGLSFAIIDEVDSILIDEARTPLIISGAVDGSSQLYQASQCDSAAVSGSKRRRQDLMVVIIGLTKNIVKLNSPKQVMTTSKNC